MERRADSSAMACMVLGVGILFLTRAREPKSLFPQAQAQAKLLTTLCPADSRAAVEWTFLK